jgi:segregation and condensation protein B
LETLSIIAYKQPITKGEIEAIRGVNSDYSIQKLLEKELVIITGRNEDLPGKPLVYATSKSFMDYFGINSPEDLPKLKEVVTDTLAEPTLMNYSPAAETEEEPAEEQIIETTTASILTVSEEGELVTNSDDGEANDAAAGHDPGSES